jgi:hypothetical protein
MLEILMKKLPEVIIQIIITYTYSVQPHPLIEDIQHYVRSRRMVSHRLIISKLFTFLAFLKRRKLAYFIFIKPIERAGIQKIQKVKNQKNKTNQIWGKLTVYERYIYLTNAHSVDLPYIQNIVQNMKL